MSFLWNEFIIKKIRNVLFFKIHIMKYLGSDFRNERNIQSLDGFHTKSEK